MRRHDSDRLGMLFGQLPGRIKYQLLKGGRRAKPPPKPAPKPRAKPPTKTKVKTAARAAGRRRARG
jgi:hypothetical protein